MEQYYSHTEGEQLVKAARHAIELSIVSKEFRPEIIERELGKESFSQKHGVFVTIKNYPTQALRGCVGFFEGVGPVRKLIVEAAIAAASDDPRFVPLSHIELDQITLEVSILSADEKIKGNTPEGIKRQIKIGRDGLIIDYGYHRGLLLPIVAIEEGWNTEQFLSGLCAKAGVPEHTWKQPGVSLYKFSTQVFRETQPRGTVEEVKF